MLRAEVRLRNRLRVLAVLFMIAALFFTVRASPVFVAAPSPAPAEALLCRTIVARLPATLDRRSARPVTPPTGLTAAWGRPAITLACGLPADPHPVSNGEFCYNTADGSCSAGSVHWFRDPFDDELWKTRVPPYLAVTFPSSDGLADVLPPISAVVLAASR